MGENRIRENDDLRSPGPDDRREWGAADHPETPLGNLPPGRSVEKEGREEAMRIGKAKVKVEVNGCYKCGTQWSKGWKIARVIPASIGDKKFFIQIHICQDCAAQLERREVNGDSNQSRGKERMRLPEAGGPLPDS
jgi:hypothetical protein